MHALRLLVAVMLVLLSTLARAAVPAGFEETRYAVPGLSATGLAWAPDGSGRLFLLDKGGTVSVATLQGGQLAAPGGEVALTPFATESVFTNSECGLLGIAFDPSFPVNHYVYLFVTASASVQRIVRYMDVGGVGTQRTVLIDNLPTRGENHNGGGLAFGRDGKLYWGIGDLGAGVGVNEDLVSLAAKVGRANPDGTPVADNPYFDGAGPNNDYVWARGFRNPFSLTFDPYSAGQPWVNVAGTNYEQIFAFGPRTHGGYDRYENETPPGFDPSTIYIPPIIKYRTNGVDERALTRAVRSGGKVTFTTSQRHGFRPGERIRVAGMGDASFDGDLYVTSALQAQTWTASQAGPDAESVGGTATTQALGGAVTGGTFYAANLFPEEYRGNFFFGDYNSGIVTRATFKEVRDVRTVDAWGTGFSQSVDIAVGPDGALYVVGAGSGVLTRVRPAERPQQLVVSNLRPWLMEGGQAVFTVQLAQAPAAEVRVSVAKIGGRESLSVAGGEALTFTPSNWNVPQAVTLAAASDPDGVTDTASFDVAAHGLATVGVEATATDVAKAPDAPPRAVLIRPTDLERVTQPASEFYGVCEDDVGCRRADFFVDDRPLASDFKESGPFYVGGEPGRWGTGLLSPGLHTVRMVVYDTEGQPGSAEARICVGTVTEGPCAAPPKVDDESEEDDGCAAAGTGGALGWLLLAGLLRRRRKGLQEQPRPAA